MAATLNHLGDNAVACADPTSRASQLARDSKGCRKQSPLARRGYCLSLGPFTPPVIRLSSMLQHWGFGDQT